MKNSVKKLISEHALFADLDEQHVETLAQFADERQIDDGESLFTQGQPARTFYMIIDGRVIVETPAIMGPTLSLQDLGTGRLLGWSWLIPPYRWHFQARAVGAATVIEFDGTRLLELCEKDPAFGYQLLKRFASLMGERLESARRRMIDAWNPSGFA